MSEFPKDFLSRMKELLSDDEYQRFIDSAGECAYRGIRVNSLKCTSEKIKEFMPYVGDQTPFYKYGYYIPDDISGIGDEPFHHAGAFYVQEPSASAAVTVLDVQKGDYVLDLCAAPGGKSTQIAAELGGTPKQASTLWQYPARVDTVYVQPDETGQTVISFVAPDSVSVWRVMRAEEDGLTEIARLEGKQGDYLSVTDEAAENPSAYVVIPRQKYFEELGQTVEAAPSRQAFFRPRTMLERLFPPGE